ncbi:hypothetical protein P3W33_09120 [Luteibacter sp. PPL552]
MLGADGRPKEWSQLHDQVSVADGHVQRLKSAVRRHQSALDDLSGEIALTTAEQGRRIAALGEVVGGFAAVRPDLAPQLMAAAYDDERQWLDDALDVSVPGLSLANEGRNPEEPGLRMRAYVPVRRMA